MKQSIRVYFRDLNLLYKGSYSLIYITILFFFLAVFFTMGDSQSIINWTTLFWNNVFEGNAIFNYANYCLANGVSCNYNFIQIIVVAFGMLPIYILNRMLVHFGISISWLVLFYYKVALFSVLLASLPLMNRVVELICKRYEIKQIVNSKSFDVVFMTSVFIWIGSVCFGQIDIIEHLFMLLFAFYFLKERWFLSAFFASLALSMKGFSILWMIPLMLLNVKKYEKYIIRFFGTVFSLPLLNAIVERLMGYAAMKDIIAKNWNHWGKLFSNEYAHMSVPVVGFIIICATCLYLGMEAELKREYMILPSLATVLFIVCASWYPQYITCMVFPVMLLGLLCENWIIMLFSFLGMNMGYFMRLMIDGQGALDNSMIKLGPLTQLLPKGAETPYPFATIIMKFFGKHLGVYRIQVCTSLFVGSLLSLLFVAILGTRIKKNKEYTVNQKRITQWISRISMIMLMALPSAFLLFSFVSYYKEY